MERMNAQRPIKQVDGLNWLSFIFFGERRLLYRELYGQPETRVLNLIKLEIILENFEIAFPFITILQDEYRNSVLVL